MRSPKTPPPSAASTIVTIDDNLSSAVSSEDLFGSDLTNDLLKEKTSTPSQTMSKHRDMQVQTSNTKLSDIGVSTNDLEGTFSAPSQANSVCLTESLFVNKNYHGSTSNISRSSINSNASTKPLLEEKYESDKNSSADESSIATSPEEPYSITNIIYSPLVNEEPSRFSIDASTAMQKELENIVLEEKVTTNECKKATMFVSPLYEAGITSNDICSINEESENAPISLKITNNEAQAAHEFPEYMDVIDEEQLEECISTQTGDHVYENDRVYENDPKKVVSVDSSQKVSETIVQELTDSNGNESFYGGEHYENISDGEKDSECAYGVNIYEDIDEENTVCGKNRYETVDFDFPHDIINGDGDSDNSEDNVYEKVRFSRNDNEYNNGSVVSHNHHYSEIEESPETRVTIAEGNEKCPQVVSEEPSLSASLTETEDMKNYLDCTEQGSKIISDSLDDGDEIGETENKNFYTECDDRKKSPSPVTDRFTGPAKEVSPLTFIDSSPVTESKSLPQEISQMDEPVVSKLVSSISEQSFCSKIKFPEKVKFSKSLFENKASGSGFSRCNSAPLDDTGKDSFSLSVSLNSDSAEALLENDISSHSEPATMNECNRDGSKSSDFDMDKSLLCKRLSEPSLFRNGKKRIEGTPAWKLADAKRLANRKQSVKDLLSKFETIDGAHCGKKSASPTAGVSDSSFEVAPKFDLRTADSKDAKNFEGGGKVIHHRFSMGDISMPHSLSATENLSSSINSKEKFMIRSDTFPELRTDFSKENCSLPPLKLASHSASDGGDQLSKLSS